MIEGRIQPLSRLKKDDCGSLDGKRFIVADDQISDTQMLLWFEPGRFVLMDVTTNVVYMGQGSTAMAVTWPNLPRVHLRNMNVGDCGLLANGRFLVTAKIFGTSRASDALEVSFESDMSRTRVLHADLYPDGVIYLGKGRVRLTYKFPEQVSSEAVDSPQGGAGSPATSPACTPTPPSESA